MMMMEWDGITSRWKLIKYHVLVLMHHTVQLYFNCGKNMSNDMNAHNITIIKRKELQNMEEKERD